MLICTSKLCHAEPNQAPGKPLSKDFVFEGFPPNLSYSWDMIVPEQLKLQTLDEVAEKFSVWRAKAIEARDQITELFARGSLDGDMYLAARWKYVGLASSANALILSLLTDIEEKTQVTVISYRGSINDVERAAEDFFTFYESKIIPASGIVWPQVAAIAAVISAIIQLVDYVEQGAADEASSQDELIGKLNALLFPPFDDYFGQGKIR